MPTVNHHSSRKPIVVPHLLQVPHRNYPARGPYRLTHVEWQSSCHPLTEVALQKFVTVIEWLAKLKGTDFPSWPQSKRCDHSPNEATKNLVWFCLTDESHQATKQPYLTFWLLRPQFVNLFYYLSRRLKYGTHIS